LVASLAVAADYVEFSVVERIRFSVPGDWPVISSKSTPEKTTFAFQIPNRADKKTSDSSNLVIVSSYLSNAQEKEDFEKKASTIENNAREQKVVDGWRCQTFTGMQKSTQFGTAIVWLPIAASKSELRGLTFPRILLITTNKWRQSCPIF
jgi:hypothetical protein